MNPHDLLRLTPDAPPFALLFPACPPWVDTALKRAPFVVMRRAAPISDRLAVGVRGETRNQRFAAWLDPRHVLETITPESLRYTTPMTTRSRLPAFALLQGIRNICDEFCAAFHDAASITSTRSGFVWGPTGSVGFELASGHATVTTTSDLDLLLRAPTRIERAAAKTWMESLTQVAAKHDTRIDIQVETPIGAFSLAEYATWGQHLRATATANADASAAALPPSRLMLRCTDGPRLVADPWEAGAVNRSSELSTPP